MTPVFSVNMLRDGRDVFVSGNRAAMEALFGTVREALESGVAVLKCQSPDALPITVVILVASEIDVEIVEMPLVERREDGTGYGQ